MLRSPFSRTLCFGALCLLSNRIRRRLRATNEASFDSYLRRIAQATETKERQEFLNSITTNETYFFRCQRHWDHFRAWLEQKKLDPDTKRNGLRLWSAAASNGAEACTMLIVLHQVFGEGFGGVNVEIVGTIATITPLLGLLGTVVGMIQVFREFVTAYASGTVGPDSFAQGIWQALITTAYGLTVAIPMLLLYRYLQGRNNSLVLEMEEDAMGIVNLLEDGRRSQRPEAAESKA